MAVGVPKGGGVCSSCKMTPCQSAVPPGTHIPSPHPLFLTILDITDLSSHLSSWQVDGLPEALHSEGVGCNYSASMVKDTWKNLQSFQGGNALFTHPNTPIKCPGAPQKIMYLTDDYLRKVRFLLLKTVTVCTPPL